MKTKTVNVFVTEVEAEQVQLINTNNGQQSQQKDHTNKMQTTYHNNKTDINKRNNKDKRRTVGNNRDKITINNKITRLEMLTDQ